MSPLTPDFSFGSLLLRVLPLFYHECVEEEKQFALCPSEVLAETPVVKDRWAREVPHVYMGDTQGIMSNCLLGL